MANSKKRRKIIIFSILGAVLLAGVLVAVFHKRTPLLSVQTEKVMRTNLTEIVVANGKVQPVVQVTISPEVSGEIISLPVKEGQQVKKGDLIVKIKPDYYIAARNQAEASYKSSLAGLQTAAANLRKAEAEFKRNDELFVAKLISDSVFDEVKAAYDVAKAQLASSEHQVEMSHASLASVEEELAKTTIVAPLTGTVSQLNSEVGERVLGTVQNAGTDIMTIADLNEMEARVDLGEMDVVLIKPDQVVRLEVDAFKDREFTGAVTEIANSAKGSKASSSYSSSSTQDATKFEVRIRIKEKEAFRPGMSVTANIETRYRTNVITVPIASVTTRLPRPATNAVAGGKAGAQGTNAPATNGIVAAARTNAAPVTNVPASATNALALNASNAPSISATNAGRSDRKGRESAKPVEVVFLLDGDHAKMVPVKIGISDDSRWEIVEGLKDGDEVISGGYRAISRDLEDGKKVKKGGAGSGKSAGEMAKSP
jgi:HlyD family secretion protein